MPGVPAGLAPGTDTLTRRYRLSALREHSPGQPALGAPGTGLAGLQPGAPSPTETKGERRPPPAQPRPPRAAPRPGLPSPGQRHLRPGGTRSQPAAPPGRGAGLPTRLPSPPFSLPSSLPHTRTHPRPAAT